MEQLRQSGAVGPEEQRDLFEQMIERALEDPHVLIEQEPALRDVDDPDELRERFKRLLAGLRDRAEADRKAEAQARAAAERTASTARGQAEALRTSMAQLTSAGVGQPIELYDSHDQPVHVLKNDFLEARNLGPKTLKSYRKAFERFEAVVGDKPVSEITKNDVVKYVEDLEQTRSDKRERARLDPETTKKCLSHIRTFFAVQLSKNRIRHNPAEGVGTTANKSVRASEQRSPFTLAEICALLDAPLFRGCKSAARITRPGNHRCRDGRFWFGLVMLFTGARNGEVEALTVDDVVRHHGRWHIDICKQLKTGESARLVSLHPDLIRMGFLDWVAHRRAVAEDGRLFEPRKYSRIWNEQILPSAGIKRNNTCAYSFRHTFEDGLKELVQDETKRRLMGHADGRMSGRYGNGRVTRPQVEAIERLDLGEVDFSFLYVYETVEEALSASPLPSR